MNQKGERINDDKCHYCGKPIPARIFLCDECYKLLKGQPKKEIKKS